MWFPTIGRQMSPDRLLYLFVPSDLYFITKYPLWPVGLDVLTVGDPMKSVNNGTSFCPGCTVFEGQKVLFWLYI